MTGKGFETLERAEGRARMLARHHRSTHYLHRYCGKWYISRQPLAGAFADVPGQRYVRPDGTAGKWVRGAA